MQAMIDLSQARETASEPEDLGPLAWVLEELRNSLQAATRALRRFARESEEAPEQDRASLDVSPLRIARQQLHQALGALEMVELAAPAQFLRAMEAAALHFVEQPQTCHADAAASVERGGFALIEYLEARIAGRSVSSVALFPQYLEIQQLAGAERAHPADLWPQAWRLLDPPTPQPRQTLAYDATVKARLDPAVLKVIRSGDQGAAEALSELCLGLAQGQSAAAPRAFWKLAAAMFEGVATGVLGVDVYVKRVASRLLQQYALLAKGDTTVQERLLQDMLFFCAQAAPREATANPVLVAVRQAWGLERHRPVDYDKPQFGLFDPALLALARKRVSAVKEIWSALSGGETARLKGLAEAVAALCDALVKLHGPSTVLAQALSLAVESTLRSGQPPAAELAMEVATSVLYLEAAFEDLDPSDAQLAERTARLAERLNKVIDGEAAPALEPWMEELYRRISDRQTMGSVVGEMRTALADLERNLDQFFRSPQDVALLRDVPSQLAQMRGVLSVLGMDQAVRALARMREKVEEIILQPAGGADDLNRRFDLLAGNLGALGFLFDMLGYQPALAKKLFVFDEEAGELKPVMGRAPEGQAAQAAPQANPIEPEAPEPVPAPAAAAEPEVVDFQLDLGGDASSSETAVAPATESAPELALLEPAQVIAPPLAEAAADSGDAAEDAELLDIFVEEAREVVGNGLAAVQALRIDGSQASEQTIVRRAFHTLKGSSRMVGLQEFGEAGWAMEQLLNAWLAENKPASPELCTLCEQALSAFGRWTDDVAAGSAQHWSSAPFRLSADAMRQQGLYLELEAGATEPSVPAVQVDLVEPAATFPELRDGPDDGSLDAGGMLEPAVAGFQPTEVQVDEVDLKAFETAPEVTMDLGAFNFDLPAPTAPEATPAALPQLPDADVAGLQPPGPQADEGDKIIGTLRIGLPLYNVYLNEADEWSRRLVTETSEWALELNHPPLDSTVALAHSLAGSSATVGFTALGGLARKLEHALLHVQADAGWTEEQGRCFHEAAQEISRLLHQFAAGFLKEPEPSVLQRLQAILDQPLAEAAAPEAVQEPQVEPPIAPEPAPEVQDQIDADVFPVFEEEAVELLPALSASLRAWIAQPDDAATRHLVLRGLHTLKGGARLVGAMRLGDRAHRMESDIERLGSETPQPGEIEHLLTSFDALQGAYESLVQSVTQAGSAPPESLPAQAQAEEDVAPLAEAVVQEPAPAERPAQLPVAANLARPAGLTAQAARVAAKQVRVSAKLLDELVGVAGEAMGTGARLEVNLGQLRASLEDLTTNLERLRQQLRDIELHAELQMQSRLALTKDSGQGFDPLEFDRFTRVQELTRMMAESVNDVATIQRGLQRTIVSTEDDLHAQARQTRELQRDLLRTRMVEFDAVSERLHRVVRQAAAETDKQVRVSITGGAIEMDRGVLDRMVPAFEHLLRNCVAHGIEDATVRMDSGKDPTGLVSVSLEQDGNDVRIKIRDDGAGLNLARIRDKAVAMGLIGADQLISDAEAANLILMPGFSTATEVTELAGRGIGMDVVRSEVHAIGGRIETLTKPGQGTTFKLVLPLTTAVTQVVLVRAGELSVGVPASLVEIVHRATGNELAEARRKGQMTLGGQEMPFYWAGALLEDSGRSLETEGETFPVLALLSASQRLALQVDEVLGHQEVVVKNLGPQLSRLPGLTGVSALPNGKTLLIYNPVALAAVYGEQARQRMADPVSGGGNLDSVEKLAPLVLVVDDSITVRRVTQRLLQREGFRVALANDGVQALERLAEERPAVMLSDIEMPRMDGFELVTQARQDPRWNDLPIIMISSRSADKHREHARQLGVTDYLGKPYGEDELLARIRHYVSLQG